MKLPRIGLPKNMATTFTKKNLGFENVERALIYATGELTSPFLESQSVWD